MRKLCICFVAFWAATLFTMAQESSTLAATDGAVKTGVYEGRVVNTSGIPIKDVFVGCINSESHAVTGIDGVFRIELPAEGDSVVISKRGLKEFRTFLTPSFQIVFILSPENTAWLPYTEYVEKMKGTAKVYYEQGLKFLAGEAGNEPDYNKAFACFFRSACMENAHAAYQLGRMYDEGLWTTQNHAKAIDWYKKAEKVPEAQTRMGIMYAEGIGVGQDYEKAVDHLLSATNLGDTVEAKKRVEDIYEKGLAKRREDNKIFDIPETSAEFPGDVYAWLKLNIKYPAKCQEYGIQGRVSVQFVIGKDGSVTDIKVLRSPDPLLAKEAARLIRSMPKWKPAMQGNKPVRQRYVLTVSFSLK